MELDDQGQAEARQQLASLGAAATPEQRALYEGDFTASGGLGVGAGEGAWELRLARDYAEFVRPGLGEDGGLPGARDYRAQGMRVTAGPLIVTIRAQDCPLSDGQSLPYVAQVLFEGVVYQGCAQRGIAGSGERRTWAADLTALLPAIDACLARVDGPARVTQASALEEDKVGVRLRGNDGGRYGCVAAVDGMRIDAFDPLLDTDRLPGEGDPEFLRLPAAEPRAGSCRSVTPAASATGEPVGWLVRRAC
jgi:hypothetical protein